MELDQDKFEAKNSFDMEPEAELPAGTLFFKNITNLDCALFSPSLGIVGESWHVDLKITGELDKNRFVVDFSLLKATVKSVLKNTIDHSLILPVLSKSVHYSEEDGLDKWTLVSKDRSSGEEFSWEYICPKGAVYPIRTTAIQDTTVEMELARVIRHRLPSTIHGIEVKLRPEQISPTQARYQYTHGITGHDGLCQRLFHGHRSSIEVFVGNERRPDLEHYVSRELFDASIHVATESQRVSSKWLESEKINFKGPYNQPVNLAYQGTLGLYKARIPAHKTIFVSDETSVEQISEFLVQHLKMKTKTKLSVKVVAYEGINKGAEAIL